MPHTAAPITLSLSVRSVEGLLDAGGSPLAGPRIHPDVARAIRAEAAEHPRKARFCIVVSVPDGEHTRQTEVQTAIRTHFHEELAESEERLRSLAQKGHWSFLAALLVVGLLIVISEAVLHLGEGRLVTVLSESLIILAWVTLWGPAETLLFARFPLWRERDLLRALAEAEVVLKDAPLKA